MGLYGGGGDGGAAAQEKARQANLDTGNAEIASIFKGYDDNFYKARGDAYTQFATPQMMDDFRNTKNNLAYSLARRGILNSGSAANLNASLSKDLSKNTGTIANAAQDQENQLRTQVADARTNLTNQLIASGDPSQVQTNAAAATAGLNAPAAFAPIGSMFNDWSNTYLSNMNATAYNSSQPSLWQQLSSFGNTGSSQAITN